MKIEQIDEQATFEAASAQSRAASEAHQAEVDRLSAAQAEVARLTGAIAAGDPDDARGISKLAADRVAAQARIEALTTRVEKARQAVEAVQPAVTAAAQRVQEAQLAGLEQEVRDLDAEITSKAREAVRLLGGQIARLREIQATGSRLQNEMSRSRGESRFGSSPAFAHVTCWASGALPEAAAGLAGALDNAALQANFNR